MENDQALPELFDQIDYQVERGKLALLVEQNTAVFIVSNLISPILISIILWLIREPIEAILAWTGFGILLCGARALHHREFKNFEKLGKSPKQWEFELILFSMLSGFYWSAACILFVNFEQPALAIFVIAAVFAHIGTSVAALATHIRIFNAYVFSLWVPTFIYYVSLQSMFYFLLAVLGTFYIVVNLSFAVNQGQTVLHTLRFRYENLRLLNELREQKLIAEEANRAKSRFLAAASHDLRQPLHAMGLFADSLSQRLQSEENTRILNLLRGSMDSLKSLFNSLLDISRLDAGAIKPEYSTFNLGELLEHLLVEYRPQAAEKKLELRGRIFEFWIYSDAVLVEQIFRNLIWNAIKYTDECGILVATRHRGQKTIVEVWDTGMGVSEEEQKRIFEEFHQINNPERDRSQGIGLGLSIVRRTGKLLNLDIGLKSISGRGSKFYVSFMPVPAPQNITPVENAQSRDLDIDLEGVSVLVVDDELDIRDSLKIRLADWGCRVTATDSLKGVQQSLEHFSPDILLTDYRLHNNETGEMIIDKVRNTMGYEVPSIIITGTTVAETMHNRSRKHVDILYKPVRPGELQNRMITALNR